MEKTAHMFGALAARRLGDGDLFSRAARGDAVAFAETYRRYQKRIYGFCLARSMDPHVAADATQETFMRLLEADSLDIEHPRAWLFTVARNLVIDAARRRTRLREDGEIDEAAPAWDTMAAADTADEVVSRATGKATFIALRKLNARYRTALILREIHGQSSADMAEALETSPGAVDTLVSRARDAFGVAYAAVCDLSPACRRSVELIYRSRGSGITAAERTGLDAHFAVCPHCRQEEKRAGDSKHLAALLPLLVPGAMARGLLGRAALLGGNLSDLASNPAAVAVSQPHVWSLGTRVAAGLLAATLVTAPIVASVAGHRAAQARAEARGASTSQALSRAAAPDPVRDGVASALSMATAPRNVGTSTPVATGHSMPGSHASMSGSPARSSGHMGVPANGPSMGPIRMHPSSPSAPSAPSAQPAPMAPAHGGSGSTSGAPGTMDGGGSMGPTQHSSPAVNAGM